MKAGAAMTREVICVEADDTLTDAYQIMTEREIRHLPVVEGRKLIGILSDRDILRYANAEDPGIDVPEYPIELAMTPNPMTCRLGTEVAAIGTAMIENKIDCLPVVDDAGELVGLVTSTDLVEMLVAREAPAARPLPFSFTVSMGTRPRRLYRPG
jgi:CBS domain-containing protein